MVFLHHCVCGWFWGTPTRGLLFVGGRSDERGSPRAYHARWRGVECMAMYAEDGPYIYVQQLFLVMCSIQLNPSYLKIFIQL